jgi:acetyl esterase/lipase
LAAKSADLSPACKEKIAGRLEVVRATEQGARPPRASEGVELEYGSDSKQNLDFYPARAQPSPPLIVFIHGGGWMVGDKSTGAGNKPSLYNGLGYAFASVNYRLIPSDRAGTNTNLTPADQAHDVANAIAFLRTNAARLGFDPNQIILMGHSAGAHLVALVSTQAKYLTDAGVPSKSVRGAILLDGAGYDVPSQLAFIVANGRSKQRAEKIYSQVFGDDPATHRNLSPVTFASETNTDNWLILYVARREDSRIQSETLGAKLANAKATVSVRAIEDSTHESVNRDAGEKGTLVGDLIVGFLATLKP